MQCIIHPKQASERLNASNSAEKGPFLYNVAVLKKGMRRHHSSAKIAMHEYVGKNAYEILLLIRQGPLLFFDENSWKRQNFWHTLLGSKGKDFCRKKEKKGKN